MVMLKECETTECQKKKLPQVKWKEERIVEDYVKSGWTRLNRGKKAGMQWSDSVRNGGRLYWKVRHRGD